MLQACKTPLTTDNSALNVEQKTSTQQIYAVDMKNNYKIIVL